MNITKKAGRPRKFDRDDALRKAMETFWKHGYEGASMKLLTEAMGINSPSLYAEFGDKHGLYLEAIETYVTSNACAPLVALEGEPDIVKAVRAFFETAILAATEHDSGARGCFMASCVSTSAGHVAGADALLQQAIAATDRRICARFEAEMARDTLCATFTPLARARLLFDLRQGLVFRARAGVARSELCADIDRNVAAVLGPFRAG